VVPDIAFPTAPNNNDHGERALDNPLPWSRIDPARYVRVSLGNRMDSLQKLSDQRIHRDAGFEMLMAAEEVLREVDEQTVVSLREQERRIESKRRELVLKDQRDAFLRAQGIKPVDEEAEDVDEAALEKQQEVIQRIQVKEAARILADSIRFDAPGRPRAVMRD